MRMSKMSRFAVCAAAALSLIATASCRPTNTQPNGYRIEETRLGPWQESSASLSPDGCHLASLIRKGSKVCAAVDGRPVGEDYDEIFWYFLGFSPDGKRLVYLARKGEKWLFVVDGQPGAEYDEIEGCTPLQLFPLDIQSRRQARSVYC